MDEGMILHGRREVNIDAFCNFSFRYILCVVIYLFPVRERIFAQSLPTKEDEQIQRAMVQMWTDFARTG